jgi:NitT/TauT family transport system permease protein
VLVVEITGATIGIGHVMSESQRYLNTNNVFACVIAVGLLGALFDLILRELASRWFRWEHIYTLHHYAATEDSDDNPDKQRL